MRESRSFAEVRGGVFEVGEDKKGIWKRGRGMKRILRLRGRGEEEGGERRDATRDQVSQEVELLFSLSFVPTNCSNTSTKVLTTQSPDLPAKTTVQGASSLRSNLDGSSSALSLLLLLLLRTVSP